MKRAQDKTLQVYLAAPLFTQHERSWNRELAVRVERLLACRVVLPQDIPLASVPGARRFKEIFSKCLEGVRKCDAVVAVLDGADADSGTAFEVGYAYALGKPIVAVRTDYREQQERGTNLMLARSCSAFVRPRAFDDDVEAVAIAIARELRRATRTRRTE